VEAATGLNYKTGRINDDVKAVDGVLIRIEAIVQSGAERVVVNRSETCVGHSCQRQAERYNQESILAANFGDTFKQHGASESVCRDFHVAFPDAGSKGNDV
jgi:hypothetical protein